MRTNSSTGTDVSSLAKSHCDSRWPTLSVCPSNTGGKDDEVEQEHNPSIWLDVNRSQRAAVKGGMIEDKHIPRGKYNGLYGTVSTVKEDEQQQQQK